MPICDIVNKTIFGEEILINNQNYQYSAIVKSNTVKLQVIDKEKLLAKF